MEHDVKARETTTTKSAQTTVAEQDDRLPVERRETSHEAYSARSWLVKALTLLLVVQGAGLIVLGILNVDELGSVLALLQEDYFYATLPILGVLALLAALGFFTLRPGAWVIAMLVQALSLLTSLIYYFDRRPQSFVLYGLMVYSIVMVLYLNYANVPAIFRIQPGFGRKAQEEEGL